ncbi:MAG: O-antigen ligase family protein [Anaerolineae bacterium]|nr:O-antigen ligase family protein [Anaerolineae bacterium]
MPIGRKSIPPWLPYFDLACAVIAGALWYAMPQLGPWPLAIGLLPWAARLVLTGWPAPRTAFDLPLVLFLVTAGLGVWAAYDRGPAWPKFWLIVGGVLLFYAFAGSEPLGGLRGWLLASFSAGVALYFLVTHDWAGQPAKIEALSQVGRALQARLPLLPGHRLHPNVAGGIIAMFLPFAGLVAWQSVQHLWGAGRSRAARRWLSFVLSLGLLAMAVLGLLMSASRGAWIALGAAFLLGLLWLLARWLGGSSTNRRAWILAFLLVGVATSAVIAVVWLGGVPGLIEALPGPDTSLGRAVLLQDSLLLARDYPLIGAGLGGFMMLHSSYALLIHVGYSVHSHSLFLDVAIEQGLGGLLALSVMWLLFAVAAWRGLIQGRERPGAGLLAAAALSLVVLVVHGLVDDVLYGSRAVLLLFVPLALAVPYLRAQAAPDWRRRILVAAGSVVLLILAGLLWWRPLLSTAYANLAAVRQSQAELSLYTWPEWVLQDEVRRAVDLSSSIGGYERALALNPDHASANRRLGQIELSLAEYEDALGHLERAYAREAWSSATRQLLGEALVVNGQVEAGRALWQDINNGQNQLEARAFWYGYIGDSEREAAVRQAMAPR